MSEPGLDLLEKVTRYGKEVGERLLPQGERDAFTVMADEATNWPSDLATLGAKAVGPVLEGIWDYGQRRSPVPAPFPVAGEALPLVPPIREAAREAEERLGPGRSLGLRLATPMPLPVPIGKAGNLNLAKLDTPDEIKAALRATEKDFHGSIDAGRRGRISLEQTEEMAASLGLDAKTLLKRRKGQAFNAEQALAARQVLISSGEDLFERAQKLAADGTPASREAFTEAVARHRAVQEQVAGMTAEAGRALGSFRIEAKRSQAIESVLGMVGGDRGADDMARLIASSNLETANRLVATAYTPDRWDKAYEIWINGLLSAPTTHVANTVSNSVTNALNLVEQGAASVVGRITRKGIDDHLRMREVQARAVAGVQAIGDATRLAARAFREGKGGYALDKVEDARSPAVGGLMGGVARIPGRALVAEDEFFKTIAMRQELAGLAFRQALAKGYEPGTERFGIDVARRIENPSAEVMEKAREAAELLTFTNRPGRVTEGFQQIRKIPGGRWVIPFVRTPGNIMKYTLDRTPVAPFFDDTRRALKGELGADARDLAVARMMVGTGIATAAFVAAKSGVITGGAPRERNQARALRDTGWQPYSVKSGDTYISYSRLEPFASIVGMAADAATMERDKDGPLAGVLDMALASAAQNLTSKSFTRGPSEFLLAISDPERNMHRFVRNQMASAVPGSSLMGSAARAMDPTLRDARSVTDAMKARIPGLSKTVPARINLRGEEIQRETPFSMANVFYQSTEKDDPVAAEMARLGVGIGQASRELDGRRLSAEAFERLERDTNKAAHTRLAAIIDRETWKRLPEEEKAARIRKVYRDAREQVRGDMRREARRRR